MPHTMQECHTHERHTHKLWCVSEEVQPRGCGSECGIGDAIKEGIDGINQGGIMAYTLGTIRTFKTKNFTIIIDAIEEDSPDFSWDATGEVLEKVERGDYLCFTARVRVLLHGREIGVDYLGNCIYESFDKFMDHWECGKQNRTWAKQGKKGRCRSYFKDMIHAAITEARKELKEAQTVKVRA